MRPPHVLLRVCLAFALVAPTLLAGCQQLASDLGGGTVTTDAGTTGSVCCGGGSCADGLPCCVTEGSACTADYDCCGGLCSGGTCVSSGATSCGAALGSRCTSVATCACTTDEDCCQVGTGAVCTNSSVTTAGKRCCLQAGIPCGGNGDCCSGNCDSAAQTCN
jgi:hypothetical protein